MTIPPLPLPRSLLAPRIGPVVPLGPPGGANTGGALPVPRWIGGRIMGGAGNGALGPEGGRAGTDPGRDGNEGLVGGAEGPDGGTPPPGPSNLCRFAGG